MRRMKKWIWDLLEWGEASKIFGLLEGMDEEECRKVVNGIKVFRRV